MDTVIDPPQERPVELARGQFGLRHLFGLMTWASLAAALVAWRGPGTLMTSAGILVAWLNLCGAFAPLQRGGRRVGLLWLAWVLFLVSLALPSVEVFDPVAGWVAAWFVLQMPVAAALEGNFGGLGLLHYLGLNAANLLMVLMPLLIWRQSRGGGRWLGAALCVSMVAPWIVLWDGAMLVGYYVWCASFLIALAAIPMTRTTLAAMVMMTALIVGQLTLANAPREQAGRQLELDGGARMARIGGVKRF